MISEKASVASIDRARGSGGGGTLRLSRSFGQWNPLKKFLGSKEHLERLKIDLNATEIVTVQDYL